MQQILASARVFGALIVYYTYYFFNVLFNSVIKRTEAILPERISLGLNGAVRSFVKYAADNLQTLISTSVLIVFLVAMVLHFLAPVSSISQSGPFIFAVTYAIFVPLVVGYMCLLILPQYWPKAEVGKYTEVWKPNAEIPEGFTFFRLKHITDEMYLPIHTIRQAHRKVSAENAITRNDCLLENEVAILVDFCKRHNLANEIIFNKKVQSRFGLENSEGTCCISMTMRLRGSGDGFVIEKVNLDELHHGKETSFLVYERIDPVIVT